MTIKNLLLLYILGASICSCTAQKYYWQQHADYTMDIKMDVQKHQFKGTQKLVYTNNSPDTLHSVFYHLYYNAFQPGSVMDVRSRTIADPDPRVEDRILNLDASEIGYHNIISLKRDGKSIPFKVVGTILEVKLEKPIYPRKKTTFEMEFESQVPVQIRRTGRNNSEGVDYSMTQWYPKMCEYDKDGWASNPYIGREFHGIWGDFDVKITIDKRYLLGGTGYIQNPQEVGFGYENLTKKLVINKGDLLTWHFKAPNVHDFAWAADPNFAHDNITLDNGTLIHFIYLQDTLVENWKKLQPITKQGFQYVNTTFGEYPYKQYSVIQGGDGGMEYPMCTLITAHGSFEGLVSVTMHEGIHSWFQGLLGTNEAKYSWMDEGFCTFAQYKTLDHLYEKNSLNPLSRNYMGYIRLANTDRQEPLTTHADFYKSNGVYGSNSYSKGAVLVMQLGYIIGEETLMRGMRRYYYEWRFKHPTPLDFKRIMEKESGMELDWYFEQFVETTNNIDYAISEVVEINKKATVTLTRKDAMPMPIDLVVKLKDGSIKWYYIPIDIMRNVKGNDLLQVPRFNQPVWQWVNPTYDVQLDYSVSEIESITIDPSNRLADVHPEDNVFPQKKSDK